MRGEERPGPERRWKTQGSRQRLREAVAAVPETRDSARVRTPGVRVHPVVSHPCGERPSETPSAGAGHEVDPRARGAAVLGRELVAHDLHLDYRIYRRREPRPGSPVVVVIEAVDRHVVRIRCAAGDGRVALFDRCAPEFGRVLVRQLPDRQCFLGDASEKQQEVQRVAFEIRDRCDFARAEGRGDGGARRVDAHHRLGVYLDCLRRADASGRERERELGRGPRKQHEGRDRHRAEPFGGDSQSVESRRNPGEAEKTSGVGRHPAGYVAFRRGEGDGRSPYSVPVGVGDFSGNRCVVEVLCEEADRKQ